MVLQTRSCVRTECEQHSLQSPLLPGGSQESCDLHTLWARPVLGPAPRKNSRSRGKGKGAHVALQAGTHLSCSSALCSGALAPPFSPALFSTCSQNASTPPPRSFSCSFPLTLKPKDSAMPTLPAETRKKGRGKYLRQEFVSL